METLAIAGILLLTVYVIWMRKLNGNNLPESLSATSYISKENLGISLPFTLMCIICVVCLFPLWITVSKEIYQFLAFLSCAGILFAGSTPLYREEFESKIHYVSGITSFVCGILWLILSKCYVPLCLIAVIGGVWTLFDHKNYTFIFEYVGYLIVILTLLFLK